jgi:AraC-like DNA-binding protein
MCYIDNLPNWQYALHSHSGSYECAYIAEGLGAVHLSDGRLPLAAGSFCILPPSTPHFFEAAPGVGMSYYTIRIVPGRNKAPLTCFFTGVTSPTVSGGREHAPYFTETFKILKRISTDNNNVVTDSFMTFCNALLELTRYKCSCESSSTAGKQKDSLPEKILLYVQAHINEALTLDILASEFHISKSHLSRLFTAAYCISPISYVISIKMGMCCTKLVQTNMDVKDIAKLAAYDNIYLFAKTFKERVGYTPEEFRKRYKKF